MNQKNLNYEIETPLDPTTPPATVRAYESKESQL